jgi:hypothetical protein
MFGTQNATKKHSENARFHAYALRTIVIDKQNRALKIDRRKTKAHSVKIYALAARRVYGARMHFAHTIHRPLHSLARAFNHAGRILISKRRTKIDPKLMI